MNTGIKILDNEAYFRQLEAALNRVGHKVVKPIEAIHRLDRYLDIHVLPLGKGHGYTIRFSQDLDQFWCMATLLNRISEEIVCEVDMDKSNKLPKSCFELWIDAIARAIKVDQKEDE